MQIELLSRHIVFANCGLSVCLYQTLCKFFRKGYDFRKNIVHMECDVICATKLMETFLFREYFSQILPWNLCKSSREVPDICRTVTRLEFSRQILLIILNIKFNENPSSARRIVMCRQTDRHDEANCRYSRLCHRA